MSSLRPLRVAASAVAAPLAVVVLLGVAGCGGGGNDGPSQRGASSSSGSSLSAPAFDADASEVASYLGGNWRVTLLPEAGEVDADAPSVSATFDADSFESGDGMEEVATLSGSVGGQDISDGSATMMRDASAYPTVTFTTDGMTVPSLTGEGETEVPGPIEWTGTLVDGRLIGEASGPGGTAAWEARRQ